MDGPRAREYEWIMAVVRGKGIHRRDFLNGVMLAGGAALWPGCRDPEGPGEIPEGLCDGPIGADPRALRSANTPDNFNVAHWLRDGRLTFSPTSVRVEPLSCDDVAGTRPIRDDGGTYDVVIVGTGLSGLSAALHLSLMKPDVRLLLLDANDQFGGNAGRDDADPLPAISSTGGAYFVDPYADFLIDFYGQIGFGYDDFYVESPFYNYYFDDRTPYVTPGARGWNLDTYGAGLTTAPYPPEVIADLQAARDDFVNWYNTAGAPTDPADNTDPQYDWLANVTLESYLVDTKKFHPALVDFYTRYTIDALGCTSSQVNALSSISFIGAEYAPICAVAGGTSGIARHALAWLIPGAFGGATGDATIAAKLDAAALDREGARVRVRQRSIVVRADTSDKEASVVYFRGGEFYCARAKAVILAGQRHTARHLIDHLLDAPVRAAFGEIQQVPVVVANVVLKSAKSLIDLGLGYNQYWWGSKYWADFVISDWVDPARRVDPNRSTVLTLYGGNLRPIEEMPAERIKLLSTPFSDYEDSLRDDLGRILQDGGFEFDRDVSAIFVYRWGHGMIFPKPGYPFGPPDMSGGTAKRTPAARHVIRAPIGRIAIAGQDVEGSPAVESAVYSGIRVAGEVAKFL